MLQLKEFIVKSEQTIIQPSTFDSFSKKVNGIEQEQDKLKAQLDVLDKLKEIISLKNNVPSISQSSNSEFILYNTDAIIHYLRKKFPQYDQYTNTELNSEKKLIHLSNWKELSFDDKELLKELSRILRDRGTIDRHNQIQIQMNKEKFQY